MSKKKQTVPSHRAHVFYAGRVQGVGFRYTAERIALDLGLVGTVINLPDGRVELICEGDKLPIEELLFKIRQSSLGPYIRKETVKWEEPTRLYTDFSVEFFH